MARSLNLRHKIQFFTTVLHAHITQVTHVLNERVSRELAQARDIDVLARPGGLGGHADVREIYWQTGVA